MKQSVISIAKYIYLNTPFRSWRNIYYRTFCALVRNRTVRAAIDGINYQLDLGEVIDVCIYLNRYEPGMSAAITKYCRPGFTVLDIGANIGAHALRLAKISGESGKVYAFEPTSYAYRKLAHNIALNRFNNITPVQIALSDKNLPAQTINFRSSWPTKGKPIDQESIVDFVTLDAWSEKEKIVQIDLIKLDVDGNEYSVIMGAKSILTRMHPVILMEVWGPNFSDNMKNPFMVLKQLGYRFYALGTGEEYVNVDDLKAVVSRDGKLLDHSFDIVAKH